MRPRVWLVGHASARRRRSASAGVRLGPGWHTTCCSVCMANAVLQMSARCACLNSDHGGPKSLLRPRGRASTTGLRPRLGGPCRSPLPRCSGCAKAHSYLHAIVNLNCAHSLRTHTIHSRPYPRGGLRPSRTGSFGSNAYACVCAFGCCVCVRACVRACVFKTWANEERCRQSFCPPCRRSVLRQASAARTVA